MIEHERNPAAVKKAELNRALLVPNLAAAFARSTSARPDAAGVSCGEDSLTYRDLDAHSNRIAHHLLR